MQFKRYNFKCLSLLANEELKLSTPLATVSEVLGIKYLLCSDYFNVDLLVPSQVISKC